MIADPRPDRPSPGRRVPQPLRVVVAGGGVAALELLLALHDLAGERARVTVIAPDIDVRLPAVEVARPFGRGHMDRLELGAVVAEHGAELVRDRVAGVDAAARRVTTASGGSVGYDVLVLAPGARARPAFDHVVTLGCDPDELDAVVLDVEGGWARSVAFVVPRGCSWTLPAYELALMTAAGLRASGREDCELHVVTPEARPLGLAGPGAGEALGGLLAEAQVRVHAAGRPRVPRAGCVATGVGADLVVDRVVALAALRGPALAGVPATSGGWIPVEGGGRVAGMGDVYAVGDATDGPVKHGALACRQADAAAAAIAGAARARAEVAPADRDDGAPWWPDATVGGRYLGPYLEARGVVHRPVRGTLEAPAAVLG